MTSHAPKLSLDHVLESFAMEPESGGVTLQRYLREYPEYATQLVDLSLERFRFQIQDESPISAEDRMRIDTAWSRIQSTPRKIATDPFADLTVPKLREIAKTLHVPRQVITAFRERTVIVASVPKRFITQLASLVGSSAQDLLDILALPPHSLARRYKADSKPTEGVLVTFEQLLRDAGVSDEDIKLLLAEHS
jgi:hypothetical protein